MSEELPVSLKDGYLLSGGCGRAEYLEKIRHDHMVGKLTLSGLPNGTGERAYISPFTLIDYRLAFGPDDAGCLAVHNNLARYEASIVVGEAIQGGVNLGPSQITYVREDYDERSGEAIRQITLDEAMSGRVLSKPGEAPVVFTELHLHALNPSVVTRGAYDSGERAKVALAIPAAPELARASNQEIDAMILAADAQFKRAAGVKKLWGIAQQKGISCTKQRLAERTKLARRDYSPLSGRSRKIAPDNCSKN